MEGYSIASVIEGSGFQISTIFICISCLYYTFVHGKRKRIHNKIFIVIFFNILITAVCNMVTSATRPLSTTSDPAFYALVVAQYVYFLFHPLLAPLFCFYVSIITGANQKLGYHKRIIYEFPMYLTTLVSITNPWTHFIYTHTAADRVYQRNAGIYFLYGVSVMYFLFAIVVLFFFWQSITPKIKQVMIYFFVIVAIGTITQFVFLGVHCELFSEALAMTGIMITVENEDDRVDHRTGILNHAALLQDLSIFLRVGSPFHVICIKMRNPLNLMQIIGPANIEQLTVMTVEYLSTMVNKNSIYYVGPGTFVVLDDQNTYDDALQISKNISDRFQKGWEFQGRLNHFDACVVLASIPSELHNIPEIMSMVHATLTNDIPTEDGVITRFGLNEILKQSKIEKLILNGLRNRNFEVFYQPIYSSRNLSICSGEALLRLHDEEVGDLYPDEFLPIAERGGLIFDLGDFVLEEVCKFLNSGIPVEMGIESLSINLSVVQCIQVNYAERIIGLISRYNVDPSRITFEIMESAAATDFKALDSFINTLREFGCNFTVNDYGVGYSNIHSIFHLDINCVKIDKMILRQAENSDTGQIILDSSIAMIKKMKKKIIISGIESQQQIDMAHDFDIDYLQGFYFSNPVSQNEFINVMRATKLAKKEEEKAIASNEAMTSFIANMSHEIRTPINAVLGMDEMILRESKDAKILEYAKTIEGAGRTLLSLINDVLDFSKIESGKLTITESEYDLNKVLSDVVSMMEQKANNKKLSFIVDLDPKTPCRLFGDEMRIRQILLNILNNAVKYTESGSVTLRMMFETISPNQVNLIFKVKDTGIGIQEKDIPFLFEKFTRLDTEKNKTIEGSGLGLAITHQILTLMNGTIEVNSIYTKGSTFTIKLPQRVVDHSGIKALEKYTSSAPPEDTDFFVTSDAKILIVDDNTVNRVVVRELLSNTKALIDEAQSGKECLDLVQRTSYDIILLDYRMPDMDGIETLQNLKNMDNNMSKDAAVIALTANAIAGAKERFLNEGFQDYITKPVNGKQLMNLLLIYLPGYKILRNEEQQDATVEAADDPIIDTTPPPAEEIPPADPATEKDDWIWFLQKAGINTDLGLQHCDSLPIYKNVFAAFTEDIPSKVRIIKESFKKEDWQRYGIEVHAIKSTAAIIGAESLSEQAKNLEMAAKENDTGFIRDNHESMLSLLLSYQGFSMNKNENENEKKDMLSDKEWIDAISTIQEFAKSLDSDNIAFVLSSVTEHRLSDEQDEQIRKIQDLSSNLEWEKLQEYVGTILENR
ncbi:MAG: EAL domain-containing protein [Lachnospiraceae bacterium]|nr:EAL domain-containing protein [Lachnospiraceae bacterium]